MQNSESSGLFVHFIQGFSEQSYVILFYDAQKLSLVWNHVRACCRSWYLYMTIYYYYLFVLVLRSLFQGSPRLAVLILGYWVMWFGLIWFPWTLSSWVRGPLKMGPSRPKTGSYRPSSPIHFQVLFLLLVSGRVIFMTFLGWHFSDQDSQLLIDLNIYLPRKNTTTVATFIWPSTWKPDNQQSPVRL